MAQSRQPRAKYPYLIVQPVVARSKIHLSIFFPCVDNVPPGRENPSGLFEKDDLLRRLTGSGVSLFFDVAHLNLMTVCALFQQQSLTLLIQPKQIEVCACT